MLLFIPDVASFACYSSNNHNDIYRKLVWQSKFANCRKINVQRLSVRAHLFMYSRTLAASLFIPTEAATVRSWSSPDSPHLHSNVFSQLHTWLCNRHCIKLKQSLKKPFFVTIQIN